MVNPAPCRVYMRLSGGKAIYFESLSNAFNIALASGIDESSYYPTTVRFLHQGSQLAGGATLVYGVEGFDVYVKVNGTEVIRFKCPFLAQSGKVAIKGPNGETMPATTIDFKVPTVLHSDIGAGAYDPRDFGARALSQLGSITGGTSTLNVADGSQFNVGDHVIVELGGEAGAGVRGTKGVGGTWPALSYANLTAMNADTSKPTNTLAWREDTGAVYQWNGSAWATWNASYYYYAQAVPRALQAKVTSKAGNALTINKTAAVTATNATVYLDNTPALTLIARPIWNKFGTPNGDLSSFIPPNMRIVIPTGDFAVGSILKLTGHMTLEGQGDSSILRSPKGAPSCSIECFNFAGGVAVKNIKQIGNARDNGFGLAWATAAYPSGSGSSGFEWDYEAGSGTVTETNAPQGHSFPYGCLLNTSDDTSLENITSVNVWQVAAGGSFCNDCWARNCNVTLDDGFRMYLQWLYSFSDSNRGGIEDCEIESAKLVAGFEVFSCNGTVITRAIGRNVVMSSNSSGDFTFEDCELTIEASSQINEAAFSRNNPIIGVNSNIDPDDPVMLLGGVISNAIIVQEGYINADDDSLMGIVVNADNPNVTITGGSYTAPDYSPGTNTYGAVGINSTGDNTDVTGFTVVGVAQHEATASGYRNIQLTGGGGSSASGCTANEIYVNP